MAEMRTGGLGESGVDTLTGLEFPDSDGTQDENPFALGMLKGVADLLASELESLIELYIAFFQPCTGCEGT